MHKRRTVPSLLLIVALMLTVIAPAASAKEAGADKSYDKTKSYDNEKDGSKDKNKTKDAIAYNVSPGAFCSPAGALGKTSAGKKMFCSRTQSDSRTRWRSPHDLPGGFSDTWGSTHAKDITWLANKNITRGCNPPHNTRFCPRNDVSRAEMAAFLTRALHLKEANHPGFTDVRKGSTFDQDIRKLAKAGITMGCNPPKNDRFCPDRAVSRSEMSAFMVRALELKKTSSKGNFADVRNSNSFRTDINRLATAGITVGCNPPKNDRFCPDRPVTRDQLASFLERGVTKK